jgi:hypothetical protein
MVNRWDGITDRSFANQFDFGMGIKGTLYTKADAKYFVYPVSDSTGGPTAEFTPTGAATATLKIRLGR